MCNIGGIPLKDCNEKFHKEPLNQEDVLREVVQAGIEILMKKGYTNYGIAETVARLVKAITLNELSVLPVSTTLQGEYHIHNVALSVPCIIGQHGIESILDIPLTCEEQKALESSASSLRRTMEDFEIV